MGKPRLTGVTEPLPPILKAVRASNRGVALERLNCVPDWDPCAPQRSRDYDSFALPNRGPGCSEGLHTPAGVGLPWGGRNRDAVPHAHSASWNFLVLYVEPVMLGLFENGVECFGRNGCLSVSPCLHDEFHIPWPDSALGLVESTEVIQRESQFRIIPSYLEARPPRHALKHRGLRRDYQLPW